MPGTRRFTRSDTSSDSGYSDSSYRSQSTAPTEHSDRPYLKHHHTANIPYFEEEASYDDLYEFDDRASVATYASTLPSIEDFEEDLPYDVPDYEHVYYQSHTTPSTPEDFSREFPTSRRMLIRHDDSTLDGNMNLQVYTKVSRREKKVDLTLFHLRMHDLKDREFSLRRYCRDSGREVCHSSRKYTKPATTRPSFQRSMSNALSTLRGKSDSKSDSKTATLESLKRHDSGYGSLSEEDFTGDDVEQSPKSRSSIPLPTNTTHLEFSNYTHIDVKRRGTKTSKRYGFEYWGTEYAWKRVTTQQGIVKQVAYHLVDIRTSSSIAHIIPDIMNASQVRLEEAKGGWVPPCSLHISDERIERERLSDVADVIVATGLLALVDDCIKSRWHQKNSGAQVKLPGLMRAPLKMNVEFVGPKRLFNRRGHTATRHATPLRQIAT